MDAYAVAWTDHVPGAHGHGHGDATSTSAKREQGSQGLRGPVPTQSFSDPCLGQCPAHRGAHRMSAKVK